MGHVCALVFATSSIFHVTLVARGSMSMGNDPIKVDRFKNVIDYFENGNAVLDPTTTYG